MLSAINNSALKPFLLCIFSTRMRFLLENDCFLSWSLFFCLLTCVELYQEQDCETDKEPAICFLYVHTVPGALQSGMGFQANMSNLEVSPRSAGCKQRSSATSTALHQHGVGMRALLLLTWDSYVLGWAVLGCHCCCVVAEIPATATSHLAMVLSHTHLHQGLMQVGCSSAKVHLFLSPKKAINLLPPQAVQCCSYPREWCVLAAWPIAW